MVSFVDLVTKLILYTIYVVLCFGNKICKSFGFSGCSADQFIHNIDSSVLKSFIAVYVASNLITFLNLILDSTIFYTLSSSHYVC